MVAQRRFGPLIVVVFAMLVVVLARLFQVQVFEHEVWAQQALGLVRSSRTLSSHRGSVLDKNGVVLVQDTDVYQVDLRYRDFRRGHPIGMLAHARASLEMRAVPLAEAWAQRARWTQELLQLSLADLDAFARGAALSRGTIDVPAARDPEAELCWRRAQDARWYAMQLLASTSQESGYLRALEGEDRARPLVDLAAGWRAIPAETLLAQVLAEVEEACAALAHLAEVLPPESLPTDGSQDSAQSRDRMSQRADAGATNKLVARLEDVRAALEDESADELFRTAAGFGPGAVSTTTLATAFDLDWIARLMRWDRARLEMWIDTRRAQHEVRLERGLLPRILVQVDLEDEERAPMRLLDELAHMWRADAERDEEGRPLSWRTTDDLVVLHEIGRMFAGAPLPRGVDVPDLVLPFQDEELRAIEPDASQPWKIVGLVSDLAGKDESGADEPLREPAASAFWSALAEKRGELEGKPARDELVRLARALDRRHAAAADRLFSALLSARTGGDGAPRRLSFTEDRLKRALQQEKYVLIDRGNRPLRLFGEPPYDLVLRIARHPRRWRGFEVCETTRRDHLVVDKDGVPCAELLVGDVRKPHLREMLEQSSDERRLSELRLQLVRNEVEEREMNELRARLQTPDEWTGGWGLESYLDAELRGQPGWIQSTGLEEQARSGTSARSPRDGKQVVLTLDARIQIAAQDVLSAPRIPDDPRTDPTWFQNPVGAIVLLSPDGDVLAAASAPSRAGMDAVPGRDGERAIRRERTLRRPMFQPPGSVFKPFLAAYAMGRLGFDPAQRFECTDHGRGAGGFETMRCTGIHVSSNLGRALTVSCNAYFAQLGLRFDTQQCHDVLATFGFGERTGILCFGTQGRSGLVEDPHAISASFDRTMQERRPRLQFGNGLSVVEATPMQVARAMAGIATGSLPNVRLVKSVGGVEVKRVTRPLDIDSASLQFVRAAMRDVVEDPSGSANKPELHERTLGFTFACKTGSADYKQFEAVPGAPDADEARIAGGKMRKHTWVAGWFPAEAPRAIVVVYLHDVAETSSHTAVYLVAQFLHTEAVRAFVARAEAEGAR